MQAFTKYLLCLLVFCSMFSPACRAETVSDESFLPTWKLLKQDEKDKFIAGYVAGWRDAARVTDVAIEYVKENPGKAVEGLQKIKGVYGLSELKPDVLTHELDQYFSDPNNRMASLSQALTAVRGRLGR